LFERPRAYVSRAPAETEVDRQKDYRAHFVALSAELDASLSRLTALVPASVEDQVPRLAALFQVLRKHATMIFDLAENFVQDKATDVLHGPFSETSTQVDKILTELLAGVHDTADTQSVAPSGARDFQIATGVVVSLIGLVIVDGFGILLARGLVRRFRRILLCGSRTPARWPADPSARRNAPTPACASSSTRLTASAKSSG
jgi:hypothetical protein